MPSELSLQRKVSQRQPDLHTYIHPLTAIFVWGGGLASLYQGASLTRLWQGSLHQSVSADSTQHGTRQLCHRKRDDETKAIRRFAETDKKHSGQRHPSAVTSQTQLSSRSQSKGSNREQGLNHASIYTSWELSDRQTRMPLRAESSIVIKRP